MSDPQRLPMKFDPATGKPNPIITDAAAWREKNHKTAWLFDPWTGLQREAWKVGSDTYGLMVIPNSIENSLDIRVDIEGNGNMLLKEYLGHLLMSAWVEGPARGLTVFKAGAFKGPVYEALIKNELIPGELDSDGFIVEVDEESADKFMRKVIGSALGVKEY
ncbi:MAG: hypothetical protein ACTS9Y_00325 [Methylophilus sp.]|uniref:hypothetical protein n=1 Tax=Methylophilus sp. TaxID=29541 RepID=UPI003F9F65FA